MKHYRKMTCVLTIISLFIIGASVAAAEEKPSGTIHFDEEQFMVLLGGDSGQGILNFKGKKYGFTTAGITAGGIGYHKVSASGKVYRLNKASDLGGTYAVVRVGLTVIEGGGGQWLRNSNGVHIHIETTQEGLALGFGVEGLTITMN